MLLVDGLLMQFVFEGLIFFFFRCYVVRVLLPRVHLRVLFFPGESLTGLEDGDDGEDDLSDLSSTEEEPAVDEERDRVSERMSSRLTLRSQIGRVSELMCSVNLEGGIVKS